MTGNELFSRIDRQLSDTQPNTDIEKRWPTAIKLLYLHDATMALWEKYMEAFFSDEVIIDFPDDVTEATLGNDLPFSDRYASNVMHYVISRCIAEDSQDANNQALAVMHYTQSGLES